VCLCVRVCVFVSEGSIVLIVGLLRLIIKPVDNQTEI
jgi:hypothetical protein